MIPSGIIFSGDEMYFKRLKDLREDSDYTQVFISEYLNMQRSE